MAQFSQQPKGTTQLYGALIILVIAVLGVGGWYWYDLSQNKNSNLVTNTTNNSNFVNSIVNSSTGQNTNLTNQANTNRRITNTSLNSSQTLEWPIYSSDLFNFSLSFPIDWTFTESQKFCKKESINNNCTNHLVTFQGPEGGFITFAHAGQNPNNLSVNEWRRNIEGRNFDLPYVFAMGDFQGYSLESLEDDQYQIMTIIYLSVGTDIFTIEWYDQEERNETAFGLFKNIITTMKFLE